MVLLEGVKPDGGGEPLSGERQEARADPPSHSGREHVEVLDPAGIGASRDGEEPDHVPLDDGDRRPPRGDQPRADPLAHVLVGVGQRSAGHQLLARAEIDIRDCGGVGEGGRSKLEGGRGERRIGDETERLWRAGHVTTDCARVGPASPRVE